MTVDRQRPENALQKWARIIGDVLDGVEEVRVYREAGTEIDPPAVAIGLPRVEYNAGNSSEPSDATFVIGLIGTATRIPNLNDEMMGLLPVIMDALLTDIRLAGRIEPGIISPGTWPNGGVDLPAYLIEIGVALP